MMIIDQVAAQLRRGDLTVDEATELFEGDTVLVYEAMNLDPATKTWDQVEEQGAGSSDIWRALTVAGATEEQADHIGAHIVRLRAIGNTVEAKLF